MNDVVASLVGAGICCIVPLLSFGLGIYYARYGLPVQFRWRGFHDGEE